ncbi:hypothetical protein HYT45_00230 [Candidatus Uhrbacteria bacterium]|nr:hypothetical protein [Candidatus Uhrbacteria bacterium]
MNTICPQCETRIAVESASCPACGFRLRQDGRSRKAAARASMILVSALFAAAMGFHVYQINRPIEIGLWGIAVYCGLGFLYKLLQNR